MFVCLCNGVTSQTIQEVIDAGARTNKDVTKACSAGSECGRCVHTIRVMLARAQDPSGPAPERLRRRWGRR
jgi:bacterioferritin-associated ferredoxin